MKCSICGKEGHNARTCSKKDDSDERNQALWMKFENLTEDEAAKLQAKIIKEKSKIAPKARGTAVKGDVRELPGRIQGALKFLGGGKNGSKKR